MKHPFNEVTDLLLRDLKPPTPLYRTLFTKTERHSGRIGVSLQVPSLETAFFRANEEVGNFTLDEEGAEDLITYQLTFLSCSLHKDWEGIPTYEFFFQLVAT